MPKVRLNTARDIRRYTGPKVRLDEAYKLSDGLRAGSVRREALKKVLANENAQVEFKPGAAAVLQRAITDSYDARQSASGRSQRNSDNSGSIQSDGRRNTFGAFTDNF